MIRVLELFAGIGACSKALTNLNIEHEIVDAVEIDEHAIKSFNAIHNTNFEPQDITKWDKNIDVDLIIHGSPCQDFSIGGLQMGGDNGSNTRSSLMYESIRIIKKIKPKYVIWENVKNLLSEKHRHNFENYLEKMEEMGYTNHYQVLNAKDYGIPQNRERVFTISIFGGGYYKQPDIIKLPYGSLQNLFERDVEEYYFNVCPSMLKALDDGKVDDITNKEYSHTLTTKQARWNNAGLIKCKNEYRYLTPKECWRLMGFDDEDYNKASKVSNRSQLYKQAGNSIVVNVLMAILKELLI